MLPGHPPSVPLTASAIPNLPPPPSAPPSTTALVLTHPSPLIASTTGNLSLPPPISPSPIIAYPPQIISQSPYPSLPPHHHPLPTRPTEEPSTSGSGIECPSAARPSPLNPITSSALALGSETLDSNNNLQRQSIDFPGSVEGAVAALGLDTDPYVGTNAVKSQDLLTSKN